MHANTPRIQPHVFFLITIWDFLPIIFRGNQYKSHNKVPLETKKKPLILPWNINFPQQYKNDPVNQLLPAQAVNCQLPHSSEKRQTDSGTRERAGSEEALYQRRWWQLWVSAGYIGDATVICNKFFTFFDWSLCHGGEEKHICFSSKPEYYFFLVVFVLCASVKV